jgi:hypothetical protein
MGIEEGEEVQAKGIQNIFNKNNRKCPKSRESYAHSCIRSLQDTKQTLPKYNFPMTYYH